LAPAVRALIERHPTFGYRRLWALLRRDGHAVNRKTVHRLLRQKGWLVHQREVTPRPRAQGRRSRAAASNERWSVDVTHVDCGADGWGHLVAVIDCHDREIIGWEFALTCAGVLVRPSGRWSRPAWRASARSVRPVRRRSCAVTTGSSSRASASGPPAATTG
jgi:putative transposase